MTRQVFHEQVTLAFQDRVAEAASFDHVGRNLTAGPITVTMAGLDRQSGSP